MPSVIYSQKAHIARIVLNRPGAGNAVSRALADELIEICGRINGDDDIYVVLLAGAGENFCGGSDLESSEIDCRPAQAIAAIDRPVIAAMQGEVMGEGLELVLAADIRLASENSKFSLPQVAGGLLPADGGTQRLPRIVGRGKALEMLLSATTLDAAAALEAGLVSRVVPPEKLLTEAEALAESIAAKGPIALRYLKEAVNQGMDMTLEQGLRLEADLYFLLHTTSDRTEGIKSFREKRKPDFKGK